MPLSAATALDSSANYSSPYSIALGVQHARPLLPGQPLPQGVAALGLALPRVTLAAELNSACFVLRHVDYMWTAGRRACARSIERADS